MNFARSLIVIHKYSNSNLILQIIESKEEDLCRCKDLHSKELVELNAANQELQQKFDKVIQIYVLIIRPLIHTRFVGNYSYINKQVACWEVCFEF